VSGVVEHTSEDQERGIGKVEHSARRNGSR